MANEEEERVLEEQLELQFEEQKDSLSEIKQALLSDPTNLELLSVQDELVSAIKDAEEGLLHLKRARLLREADSALQGSMFPPKDDELGRVQLAEPPDPKLEIEDAKAKSLYPSDIEPETLEEQSYCLGSKCKFRHTDGRWYNGQIVELISSSLARVSFLTPTSEKMMICKFFLQQRCRFGANCRLSHGFQLPLASLKTYVPTSFGPSYVGSSILAVSESGGGIWRHAELESWDDQLNQAQVVFMDNGSSEKLGTEAMALSQYAEIGEDEDTDDSQSGSSDYEEDEEEEENSNLPQGLGFVESTALQKGIQTDTAIFAKWENHTRGIASKMMANMGYREGMGLGLSGQGIVDPILVKVLPPKQSLDQALKSSKNNEVTQEKPKKRSRGGKRKRDKKFAEAARATKQQEEEQRRDVFSLINNHLATHAQMMNGGSAKKKQKSKDGNKKEDRRSLVAYDDEVKELRVQVGKLEEMVNRNRNEKAVFEAANRRLSETQKALAEAEAKHASASHSVVSKEKEKRWLRF